MSRLFTVLLVFLVVFVFTVSPVMAQDDVVPDGESIVVQYVPEPTIWDVAPIVFGFGSLLVFVIWMIIQGKNPAQIDKYASDGLLDMQKDRKLMDILETLVQKQPTLKDFVDASGKFISGISDHIPGATDNAVGGFLQDIAVPGAPDDLTAHSSEALIASNRTMTAEDWGHWDKFLTWWPDFCNSSAFDVFSIPEPPVEDDDTAFNIVAEGGSDEQ